MTAHVLGRKGGGYSYYSTWFQGWLPGQEEWFLARCIFNLLKLSIDFDSDLSLELGYYYNDV